MPSIEEDLAQIRQQTLPSIDSALADIRGEERPLGGGGAGGGFDELTWEEAIKSGVKAFPESAKQVGKDIVSAFAHPFETAKSIDSLVMGLGQKLFPGEQDQEKYADAFADYFSRYTSVEGFKEALATDPAGIVGDLFSVLVPQGAVSKLGITQKVGKAVQTTAGGLGKQVLGVTTGLGSAPIRKAFEGGKTFKNTMHRKILMEEVVRNSNSGLRTLANERRAKYRADLAELRKSNIHMNMAPIRRKLDELMGPEHFNIRRVVDEETGLSKLDFSRSSLDSSAHAKITEVINKIDDWG